MELELNDPDLAADNLRRASVKFKSEAQRTEYGRLSKLLGLHRCTSNLYRLALDEHGEGQRMAGSRLPLPGLQ